MRDIVKALRRPPTGRMADRNGGLAQGFRTALRAARDAPHRHAPRAMPKTLESRRLGRPCGPSEGVARP